MDSVSASNSRQINSSQTQVHASLERKVLKHLNSDFKRPYNQACVDAFALFLQAFKLQGEQPIILDSACGNGESTLALAQKYPERLVLGVDKSAARINKPKSQQQTNCLLLRADMLDIWRLLVEHQVPVQKQYMLYPNPWPKLHQLQRRWHGSPIFKSILALNCEIELRSNWPIYVQEFDQALHLAKWHSQTQQLEHQTQPVSPFEQKYQNSGHSLWACYAKP